MPNSLMDEALEAWRDARERVIAANCTCSGRSGGSMASSARISRGFATESQGNHSGESLSRWLMGIEPALTRRIRGG